ncbi:putative P450 monooxygenase [Polychaeton citri CBS 116435]|uniref:P450 monooxygenase n=1 Tax=Polychaeton citri CBS 116435 TaxID=1314669 RepID=A0A9P4UNY9_9PEZI|nr:putative P450 monooxygenase [Polychaeton citri CBS 116435]
MALGFLISVAFVLLLSILLHALVISVYNVYFHPLKHIPGPKLAAATRIPYICHVIAGTTVTNITRLHEEYGEVVRFSPDEVSFISAESAWPDIYGSRTGKMKGHPNMPKSHTWYAPSPNNVPSILIAGDEDHFRIRRVLAPAFTEKALNEQEALLQDHTNQIVSRLKEACLEGRRVVDMVEWYVWTTFDIMTDLVFGKPVGCLLNAATHKYLELLYKSVAAFRFYYIMANFPMVKKLGNLVVDKDLVKKRIEYFRWVSDCARNRLTRVAGRPDFMTYITRTGDRKDATGLADEEIFANCHVMLIAGSETTATLLSGLTYLLLMNPDVKHKLELEVRNHFTYYQDIKLSELSKMPYLLAVLNEGLRYYPPVPTGFERTVGPGGEVISGYFIPETTGVCVSSFPSHHSKRNFRDPDVFAPERWMDDPHYASDKRNGFKPFSFGPRGCLGKNLAYAEMRLILAKFVWSFDAQIDDTSMNWLARCKVMTLWVKPKLLVNLKVRSDNF